MYDADWLPRLKQLALRARSSADWRVPSTVWGLGITSLLTDVSSEMVVSVLPAYLVLTNGLAPLALGIATGLHQGGSLLATWLGGWIADRSARRKLTAACGYAISAACRVGWLTLSGRDIGAVALLVLGDRAGKAIRTAPRDALISLSVPPRQLATAFGVHRAMDAAGAAGGPVLAWLLLRHYPQRYDLIFFTSFVVAVLGVAALVLLVSEDRREPAVGDLSSTPSLVHPLAAFAIAPFRRALVMATALGLVTIGDAFLYVLLAQRSHAHAEWIPLFYTGTALSFLVLAVPIGFVADRIGRRRVFILAHAPLFVAYLVVLGGFPTWPWNAASCVLLLGMYYAASDGVLAGLVGGLVPAHSRSIGLAWSSTAVSLARLCSAVTFGALWTGAGDVLALVTFTCALVIVVVAAGVADTLWGSEPTDERPADAQRT